MNPDQVTATASTQRIFVWCTPVFFVAYGLAFILGAGFVPPPTPSLSAVDIAQIWIDRAAGIRVAGLVLCLVCPFIMPIFVVMFIQMRRIEGRWSPWAYLQFSMATILIAEFVVAAIIIMGLAYYPDVDPDIVKALNSVIWMDLVGITGTALFQWLAMALCILRDKRPDPIFPRWYGYLCLWVALGVCGGTFAVLFKAGPLSWDGIIAYWLPLAVWIPWCGTTMWMLLRVIAGQEAEELAEVGAAPHREAGVVTDLQRGRA